MISSTFTSVTFVIRLLLFTSCLFNNFVFTTKPLSDGLQDLRNDWKDTLIQNKSIDFSDRKEASFSGPLRTDEKFQQIKLSPPLRDFGYPALVSDGTELHAKIILIRANLNVKDEETVVNFIRSFVKGTHGHKITDMTAFDWNDDNVCVFFEFWSWYVEHQLTALRNGWRKAEYKQVRYEHFDDHSKTKLIGKGNYGKVYLVKRRKDNKDFAMKDMLVDNVFTETKRDLSYRKRRIDYMFSEVDVLTDIKTEFTTDMVGFDIEVDPNNRRKYSIVIFLEYVSGGELFDYIEWWRDRHNEAHITKSTPATGIAVPEWIARDFFVQLATAVQKIHEAGIGHRDIKPENILIDEKGRVQLTDFGLAKRFNGGYRSDIGVGSLHYMAPELVGIDYYGQIVHNPKHNQLVDWWSLTTVLYSILTCRSAFGGVSNQETTSNIVKGKVHRLFSHQKRFISGECWNFMIRMLQPDMRRRLSRNGLSEEFMRDPWFGAHHGMKAIDWKNVKDMPVSDISPRLILVNVENPLN